MKRPKGTLVGVFSRRTAKSAPAQTKQRGLTASAARSPLNDRRGQEQVAAVTNETRKWQREAWDYFDEIGEIKYAYNLLADIVANVALYAAVVPDSVNGYRRAREVDDLTPNLARAAEMALTNLRPADGTREDLIRPFVYHLSIPGEGYLVRTPAKVGSGTPRSWDIRSIDEIEFAGGKTYRKLTPDGRIKEELDEAQGYYCARIWNPHPRYSQLADSPMRGVLDLCAELMLVNSTFRSTARSRLNSGILFVPDTLTVTGVQGYEETDEMDVDDEFESFETELVDSMTTPIADETSAAAVVPLVIRGPAEAGQQINYISIQRSFDEQLTQRADRVLERILQGINLPKDVVAGLANVKYSNAVKIEESLYQQHVEPLVALICKSLTTAYLRPVLRAEGFSAEQVARVAIWYDSASVVAQPDRTETSRYAHENFMISDEAWMHYNGFSLDDAPDGEEVARRVAFQKGQVLPEYLDKVLQQIAPEQAEKIKQAVADESPTTALPPAVVQALGGGPSDSAPPSEAPTPTPEPSTEEPSA